MPGAHACIPSYSGSREMEDLISQPAQIIVLKTISKITQKGLVE
jgi:hypothetical protein